VDEARDIATGVDHGIPRAPPQCPEIPGTITAEIFCVREKFRARVPAVEERHLVLTVESRLDDVAPKKERPPED
jgi:hypothetical protein